MRVFLVLVMALLIPLESWGAFAITKNVQGFQLAYCEGGPSRPIRLPATAAEAFTVGQPVIRASATSLLTGAVAADTNIIGVSLEARTIPAATSSSSNHDLLIESNLRDCVFAVNLDASSELDDAAVTYQATKYLGFGTGLTYATEAVNNSIDGHLIVIYDGPCAGQARVCVDYDAAGGAADQLCELNRPFGDQNTACTPTTDSSVIILGTGTDTQGIFVGGKTDIGGTSTSAFDGSDIAGPLMIVNLDEVWKGVILVSFTDNVWSAP